VRAESVNLAAKWSSSTFPGLESVEQAIVTQANGIRQGQHLSALVMNTALRTAARQHAIEMGAQNYFAHESPVDAWRMPWQRTYRAGYWGQQVGENIVAVENPTLTTPEAIAAYCLKLWLNSPGHRANLLNPKWSLTGIGVARQGNKIYAVHVFATPLVTLEHATLEPMCGELITLTLSGDSNPGIIHLWVDGQHQGSVTPNRDGYSTSVSLLKGTGTHTVSVSVGTRAVWQGTVETNAERNRLLKTPRILSRNVVERTTIDVTAFDGFHLTGSALAPLGKDIQLLKDDATAGTPNPDAQGRITFDMILPQRETPYTISIAVDTVMESLLFIDTRKPLDEAFLGRPE